MKKVCVITGSRADYGLLSPVMRSIDKDPDLELQIIVTGSHLEEDFGLTYREIEGDNFKITGYAPILGGSDDPLGVLNAMSVGLKVLGSELQKLAPDMVVVLGDRYEMMVAAQAAMILQIPLTHISGGDVGGGTYDNIIRHCITKMASVHFVTHEEAHNRVLQLGERADLVFNYGSTCVENIIESTLLTKQELGDALNLQLKNNVILVTYHPLTMGASSTEAEVNTLLEALDFYHSKGDYSLVFTKANADAGGKKINQMLLEYIKLHKNASLHDSLGRLRYLSLLKAATVVVGNSSSGIYEAPYLETPTVDVGVRQEGRVAPNSVFRSNGENSSELIGAIDRAISFNFSGVIMMYGDGQSSRLITEKIKELSMQPGLCSKKFVDRLVLNDFE
jgi:UDP-hydrolysing UDP-N-acetyl-D-glucosamine 2-epimerase